ncbi:MAG TPA: HYR domain-containing protein [Gaiellaceae bacterium]
MGMRLTLRRITRLVLAAGVVAGLAAVPVASGERGQSELALHNALSVRSDAAACPQGTPPEADECFARSGGGVVPGLGMVSEAYTFIVDTNSPSCPTGDFLLASAGKLTVAGKGEIAVALAGPSDCYVPSESVLQARQPFTITGGTGPFVGASGSGVVEHNTQPSGGGRSSGNDTWVGMLAVPGIAFDLTPPVITGAVAKSVRAPRGKARVRVAFRVKAHDEVDSVVAVTCVPRSRSWFRIGRKTVKCSTTDTSGNAASAKFTVTVKRRR